MDKLPDFGGFPAELSNFDSSAVVILPVPYDATSTWVKGADQGPRALLEASPALEFYDIETDSEVYLKGIHTADPIEGISDPEEVANAVEANFGKIIEAGKFPVLIGGEHSVSVGAIMACAKKYSDITILQLDAHTDLRSEYEGSKFNHACVMSRAKEVAEIVQVGIRSMDSGEKSEMQLDRIFFAQDIAGKTGWEDNAVQKLRQNVYITIDLDVFDPSIMPSTGTPEPGGLLWYETIHFLRKVAKERNIVGFDIVELCPNKSNKAPDFLAAKLLYIMLTYKFML